MRLPSLLVTAALAVSIVTAQAPPPVRQQSFAAKAVPRRPPPPMPVQPGPGAGDMTRGKGPGSDPAVAQQAQMPGFQHGKGPVPEAAPAPQAQMPKAPHPYGHHHPYGGQPSSASRPNDPHRQNGAPQAWPDARPGSAFASSERAANPQQEAAQQPVTPPTDAAAAPKPAPAAGDAPKSRPAADDWLSSIRKASEQVSQQMRQSGFNMDDWSRPAPSAGEIPKGGRSSEDWLSSIRKASEQVAQQMQKSGYNMDAWNKPAAENGDASKNRPDDDWFGSLRKASEKMSQQMRQQHGRDSYNMDDLLPNAAPSKPTEGAPGQHSNAAKPGETPKPNSDDLGKAVRQMSEALGFGSGQREDFTKAFEQMNQFFNPSKAEASSQQGQQGGSKKPGRTFDDFLQDFLRGPKEPPSSESGSGHAAPPSNAKPGSDRYDPWKAAKLDGDKYARWNVGKTFGTESTMSETETEL